MPRAFKRETSVEADNSSAQQKAIYEEFRIGTRNIIVGAYAGTGKTTTILRAIPYAPERSILVGAFNKANQVELEQRLEDCPHAMAQTWHSVGFAAVREQWGRVILADRSERSDHLAKMVASGTGRSTERLVSMLLTKAREITPMATTQTEIIDLAANFDLLPERGNGLRPEALAMMVLDGLVLAAQKKSPCVIDYADMIFLPLRNGWLTPTYDMVIADEAQDMTMAQLSIAQQVCKGRMCVVGDRHQAIYRFRGADCNALDRLKTELNAVEYGLTTTYRCPKSVVVVARQWVPDYEAQPGAPEGRVKTLSGSDSMNALVEQAKPGDFIVSRTNAPLMRIVLRLLRSGVKARIQGREIGQGLITLVRRLSYGTDVVSIFLANLRRWETDQRERLEALGKAHLQQGVIDKAETLKVLAMDSGSVEELVHRLEGLFTDTGVGQVVCSTVHRVKGLEANTVFVLRNTLFIKQPCVCGHYHTAECARCTCGVNRPHPERVKEEINIAYVAVTRAKETLVWVEGIR